MLAPGHILVTFWSHSGQPVDEGCGGPIPTLQVLRLIQLANSLSWSVCALLIKRRQSPFANAPTFEPFLTDAFCRLARVENAHFGLASCAKPAHPAVCSPARLQRRRLQPSAAAAAAMEERAWNVRMAAQRNVAAAAATTSASASSLDRDSSMHVWLN